MANKKISQLDLATTPLTGTEEIELVQSGISKRVAVSEIGGGGSQNLQQVTDEGNETTQHIKVKLIDETDEYISEITPNYIEVSKRDIASSDIIRNAFDVNSITRFNTLEGSYSINLTEASDAVPTLVQRVLKAPILTADATIATLNDIEFIVVSSSRTASNDTNYSVVANATFTDPTPVEGKGYIVFVRNGTATIGGVGYTAGRNVYRFFHSGAWSSVVYVDKDYVDAKVQNSLTASTTIAPSATAVNTALGLKQRTLKDFDTKEGFYLFEDFIGNPANSNFNSFGVSTSVSGAGASCLPNTTYPNRTNQQGVIQLSAGTTTTGFSIIRIGDANAGSHYLGNGVYTMQFFANIETLSDATNRFYNFFGATATNNVLSTNIIAFIYDEGGASANIGSASPNWKCVTRLTSTSTVTTTTVPIVAGEWFVLRIVVNANASSIEFFINNVSVATHTTNIPTLITPRIAHIKTAGTTNRNIFADYMLIEQIYTTPRTI
jgi:hypothetical protein